MQEDVVRRAAEQHCLAIAEGDLDAALKWVAREGRKEIGANLARVVHLVKNAEVEDVRMEGEEAVVHLRFTTSDSRQPEVRIESHWAEDQHRPLLHWAYQV
jgi:hypothetical protein